MVPPSIMRGGNEATFLLVPGFWLGLSAPEALADTLTESAVRASCVA
jgi:hypothetical protein